MASSALVPALVDAPASTLHGGLVLAPRPFAREEEISLHGMPEGLSVAQMLAELEVQGALDPALRPWVRVTIGGQPLARELWAECLPQADQTIVVEVAPMGSNAVRTILQIAVLALAAFTGGVVAGSFGALAGAFATAAISVGGMLAVNAIAPIKQPELAAREQRYSLDGGSNAARPNEVIPVVAGRRRIFPPRCANWYTVTVNNVVYLRMMFQPCVSWVDHESPRIGQAALESFDGVTVRWATRPDEDIAPIWFDKTPAEDSLGLPVKLASGWVTKPAPLKCDELSIDVAFLAGLFETKDSGAPKNRSVTFEFRYGPRDGDPDAATPCPFAGPGGLLTFTRDKLESYRLGWRWTVPLDDYDIHIRRVTAEDSNNARIRDELTWVCVRSFRAQPPVRDLASKPWIELELQASDQLNGVPNDFNFIATSIVPRATADGPGELIATRNPADLFLAASYPPLSDVELDDDERDFAAIAAWRAVCETKGWHCDLAEQSELSVGELLQRTAAAGRARPTLDYGALSVVVDWEKPFPRQMFTPRTVSAFQGEVVVPAPVHALRVRFPRADKDYDDDTVTVFAQKPGSSEFYDLDSASIYEAIEIRDKTDIDEVEWEGARLLAERVLRPERFTFEQDIESLTAREGARAWLAHHVALVGEISGRVTARFVDPSDATHKGLSLDEAVVMVAGRSYDLAWRPSADAALQVFPLETLPGQSDIVWFADPAPALAAQPLPGDLVVVFEHAVELLDVVIDRIEPKDGLKASITCVPYAEALQHVGEGPIPAYRTSASKPPTLPGAGTVIGRTNRAIDQLLTALGEAVKTSGNSIEAIKILQDLMQASLDQYAGLTDQALAEAVDLRLRIYDAIVDAGGKVLDLKNELLPPSGRPVGATLDDQVRQVETAKETIIEHYTEMTVGFANAAAALETESIVRATQDEALSAFQIALAAVVNDNYSTLNVAIATLTTQQNTTAMALTTLTSNFNGNVASVSSQLSTLSSAQSAQASSISSLSSTVGGHTASISSISATLASINGQLAAAWGVDVTIDGRSIGIKGINSGVTGGWVFDGDYFFFRTPGGNKPLVSITGSLIYLASNVRIGGDLVLDGSLTFTKVGANQISDFNFYADGTNIDITTFEQSMGGYYRYCAGGDIDVTSGFAVQNNGSTDDGTNVGLYCDGALIDTWPRQWPKAFTERDSQTTTIANPGVGWHFIELKAYALSPSANLRKILVTLPSTNRKR